MLMLNVKVKIRKQKYNLSFPLKNIVVPQQQIDGITNSTDAVFKALGKKKNTDKISHTEFISGIKKNKVVRDQLREALRFSETVKA